MDMQSGHNARMLSEIHVKPINSAELRLLKSFENIQKICVTGLGAVIACPLLGIMPQSVHQQSTLNVYGITQFSSFNGRQIDCLRQTEKQDN